MSGGASTWREGGGAWREGGGMVAMVRRWRGSHDGGDDVDEGDVGGDGYGGVMDPVDQVPLPFQESAYSLSTLHFLKFPENSFEVLKLLENIVEVLKILDNKLESMKIPDNKLESLKL
ncbi:hypothetical protein Tco_0010500 [Tanacetum coccineum]